MRTVLACVWLLWAGPSAAQGCEDWLTEAFVRGEPTATTLGCAEAAGLDARAEDGSTALHLAAAANDAALVRALLALGADAGLRDRNGLSPLDVAAERATDAGVPAALLAWGVAADPAGRWLPGERATTPLMRAAGRPDGIAVLTVLLAAGADPSWRDAEGNTALHLALGDPAGAEAARLLLRNGAAADAASDDGSTPLHVAASYGADQAMAELLLDAGASADAEGAEGVTPLMLAAAYATEPGLLAALLDASEEPCKADESTRTARLLAEANPALRDSPPYWELNQLCPATP